MTVTADFNPKVEDGKCVLRFSGNLTLLRVRKLTEQLGEIEAEQLIVDLSDVERMDTVGAWLVHKLERDRGARIVGATEDQQTLIDHVARQDEQIERMAASMKAAGLCCPNMKEGDKLDSEQLNRLVD